MSTRNFVTIVTTATLSFVALSGCAQHHGTFPGEGRVAAAVNDWSASVSDRADKADPAWTAPVVTPASAPAGPQAVADTDDGYLLDTGDQLRIFVYGQPNLSRLYTVDHRGNIAMPLIGRVKARKLTTYQLANSIGNRLSVQFVRDPQVTVDVNQNRPFFILGEVRTPGQYPYVSGMTIKTAVAIGGGYSERAKKGTGRVTRRVNGVVEVLDVSSDYVLKPGDTVEIHERLF